MVLLLILVLPPMIKQGWEVHQKELGWTGMWLAVGEVGLNATAIAGIGLGASFIAPTWKKLLSLGAGMLLLGTFFSEMLPNPVRVWKNVAVWEEAGTLPMVWPWWIAAIVWPLVFVTVGLLLF